jgi:hypothetical protein
VTKWVILFIPIFYYLSVLDLKREQIGTLVPSAIVTRALLSLRKIEKSHDPYFYLSKGVAFLLARDLNFQMKSKVSMYIMSIR